MLLQFQPCQSSSSQSSNTDDAARLRVLVLKHCKPYPRMCNSTSQRNVSLKCRACQCCIAVLHSSLPQQACKFKLSQCWNNWRNLSSCCRQANQQTQQAQHIHAPAACRMVSGKRKASAKSSDATLQVHLGGCQVGAALRGGELVGRHIIGLLGSDQQHLTSGQVVDWAARKVLAMDNSCSSPFAHLQLTYRHNRLQVCQVHVRTGAPLRTCDHRLTHHKLTVVQVICSARQVHALKNSWPTMISMLHAAPAHHCAQGWHLHSCGHAAADLVPAARPAAACGCRQAKRRGPGDQQAAAAPLLRLCLLRPHSIQLTELPSAPASARHDMQLMYLIANNHICI
jgi:hypothetical protein